LADSTKLPSLAQLTYFTWSTPTASNPRLSAPIDADDTTISFTSAPLDENAAVITAPFLMGVKNSSSFVETIYCPNGADGASGLSATGCVRGIELAGLDYTVGEAANAASHDQDSPVFCNITAVVQALQVSAIRGDVASGGSGLIMGTDLAANTVTISRSTGAGTNLPWIRWNSGGSEVEFSDNGTDWTAINDVTASNLVDVSAADTTPGYLGAKINARGGLTDGIGSPAGNETVDIDIDLTANTGNITPGLLATSVSDVTATATEINDALDGISANVTDTNLNTLTAGAASDANALHTHSNVNILALTAGEAIDGSSTPQALCQAGENYKGEITVSMDGLNGAVGYQVAAMTQLAVGNVDATFRRSQSFTYTDGDATTITVGRAVIWMTIAGTPGDNFRVLIQGDSGGFPDKSTITNGTSNNVSSPAGGNRVPISVTWATPPTITSGTKYHMVFERTGAADAVNYYNINYELADNYGGQTSAVQVGTTTTWGSSNVNDILFHMELNLDYQNEVFLLDTDDMSKCNFIGFSEDNVAASASIYVSNPGNLQDGFTGLTQSVPYYGTATGGSINTSGTAGVSQTLVPVGKTRSDTTVYSQDALKRFKRSYTAGENTIAEISANATFFVPCGFRPNKLIFTYTKDDTGTGGYTVFKQYTATTTSAIISVNGLDGSQRITTGVSTVVNTDPGGISLAGLYENGFRINIAQAVNNEGFMNFTMYAEGY